MMRKRRNESRQESNNERAIKHGSPYLSYLVHVTALVTDSACCPSLVWLNFSARAVVTRRLCPRCCFHFCARQAVQACRLSSLIHKFSSVAVVARRLSLDGLDCSIRAVVTRCLCPRCCFHFCARQAVQACRLSSLIHELSSVAVNASSLCFVLLHFSRHTIVTTSKSCWCWLH